MNAKTEPFIRRRDFLKSAAAAIAAPSIVSSSVLGLNGQTSPNNRVTLGFIGTGKMANDFLSRQPGLLASPNVEMGSGELAVPRRIRRRSLAGPGTPRSLAVAGCLKLHYYEKNDL